MNTFVSGEKRYNECISGSFDFFFLLISCLVKGPLFSVSFKWHACNTVSRVTKIIFHSWTWLINIEEG